MTKIKLANGIIVRASDVKIVNGVLNIQTVEFTVEELAEIFSNKENTSIITLMTESEMETGYKTGFTSFAGIHYDTDGVKTVELYQPIDDVEARVSKTEGELVLANARAGVLEEQLTDTQMALVEQYEENLALQEELTNTQLAICEIYEGMEV